MPNNVQLHLLVDDDDTKNTNGQDLGGERRLTTNKSSPALSLGRSVSMTKKEFCLNLVRLTKGRLAPAVRPAAAAAVVAVEAAAAAWG